MFAPKKILVPTDFSPYADKALKAAVELATQFQAKLFLLHVIDQHIQQCAADYCLTAELVAQIETDSLNQARERLQKEAGRLVDAKQVDIVIDVRNGNPADELLREQQTQGIDLVVIASHGRTGVKRFLIGSVTDKVVRGATCSVIVVKP